MARLLRRSCLLAFLAAAALPARAPAGPVPEHQELTVDSKILGETRRVNVYLPPGYDARSAKDCLVLYMPDGGMAEDFPHVAADVDAAIRAGEMRPAIVVGIENTERRRDMTGPTEVESDRKIAPRVGGSARFRAFLRDELMPVVRARFPGNGGTAIVGESLAGLFVLETFFEEPGMFDTYIALSPSLWWNGGALVQSAAERLKARPTARQTLYFATAGDDQQEDAANKIVAALRGAPAKGLTWRYEGWPREKHSTIYVGASPAIFRKLFPPLPSRGGAR
ncbi:MAG TPA: alpha/beta hydrolase-fold protein [Thermoanaerobaculia bacterium]|nr:alpha/beta hydrolase-fold protein [Thermoanaerobaculia bacterium]